MIDCPPQNSDSQATVISAIVCGKLEESKIQVQLSQTSSGLDLFIDSIKMDLTDPMFPSEFYVGSALVVVDSGLGVRVTYEEGFAIYVRYSKDALVLVTAASSAFTSSGLTLY